MTAPDAAAVLVAVAELSARFAEQRGRRQHRRDLDPADFSALLATGFGRLMIPRAHGGFFESPARSVRGVARALRALAAGDSSVALVAAMHPAVLSYWFADHEVSPSELAAFEAQRRWIVETLGRGEWWGTITSEPGSGGDILKTRALAAAQGDGYRLTGAKHFGSGSGVVRWFTTTARVEGEADPDLFVLDVAAVPWDGSCGMRLTAPWNGVGMTATQSHAFEFKEFPARRCASGGRFRRIQDATGGFIGTLFAAVVAGVVDAAVAEARRILGARGPEQRPYETVTWVEAEAEAFALGATIEAMIAAMEVAGGTPRAVLLGKLAAAELAESVLRRLSRAVGGGSYTASSPFSAWFEDVRALGFLRPPWALLVDRLASPAPRPEA